MKIYVVYTYRNNVNYKINEILKDETLELGFPVFVLDISHKNACCVHYNYEFQ